MTVTAVATGDQTFCSSSVGGSSPGPRATSHAMTAEARSGIANNRGAQVGILGIPTSQGMAPVRWSSLLHNPIDSLWNSQHSPTTLSAPASASSRPT
jgi:hypothetical protein